MKRSQISAGQFAVILLVSRLVASMAFAPGTTQLTSGSDFFVSILMNAVGLIVLFLPTWWFNRHTHASGTLEYSYILFGKGGIGIALLYMVFSLYILVVNAVQFIHFVSTSLSPDMPVWILCILVIAAGFWSTFYGLEAIGRGASVIAVVVVLSVLIAAISLIPEFKWLYFPPLFYNGVKPVMVGFLEEIPRTVEMAVIGILLPYIKGSATKSFFIWNGVLCAVMLIIQATIVGVLGDFGGMVAFPYHTVITAAKTAVLERLDVVTTSVWVAALFVKIALFALVFVDCGGRVFGYTRKPYCALVGSVLSIGLGLWLGNKAYQLQRFAFNITTVSGLLLLAVVLPLALVLVDIVRKRRLRS